MEETKILSQIGLGSDRSRLGVSLVKLFRRNVERCFVYTWRLDSNEWHSVSNDNDPCLHQMIEHMYFNHLMGALLIGDSKFYQFHQIFSIEFDNLQHWFELVILAWEVKLLTTTPGSLKSITILQRSIKFDNFTLH